MAFSLISCSGGRPWALSQTDIWSSVVTPTWVLEHLGGLVSNQTMQGSHKGRVKFLKPGLLSGTDEFFLFSFLSVSGMI